jgi:hypothetical protein
VLGLKAKSLCLATGYFCTSPFFFFPIQDKKTLKKSADKNLEIIVTNGYKGSFVQDIQSDIHTDSSRSTRSSEDEKPGDESSQQTGHTIVCAHQGIVLT